MIKFIIVEDEKEYQDIYKNIIDKIKLKMIPITKTKNLLK